MQTPSPHSQKGSMIQDPEHEQEGIDDGRSRQCRVEHQSITLHQGPVSNAVFCGCHHHCYRPAHGERLQPSTRPWAPDVRRYPQGALLSPADASFSLSAQGSYMSNRDFPPMSPSSMLETDIGGGSFSKSTLSPMPSPITPYSRQPESLAGQNGSLDSSLPVALRSLYDDTAFLNAAGGSNMPITCMAPEIELPYNACVDVQATALLFDLQDDTPLVTPDMKLPSTSMLGFPPVWYSSPNGAVTAGEDHISRLDLDSPVTVQTARENASPSWPQAQITAGEPLWTVPNWPTQVTKGSAPDALQTALSLQDEQHIGLMPPPAATYDGVSLAETPSNWLDTSFSDSQNGHQQQFASQYSGRSPRSLIGAPPDFASLFERTWDKKWSCRRCHRQLADRKGAFRHAATHDLRRPYICRFETCDRSYKRQDHLKRHMDKHDMASVGSRGTNSRNRHISANYTSRDGL